MKTNLIIPALFLLLLTLFSSCEQDPCKKTECLNGGTCIEGTCECPEGYTGENCGTLITDCGAITCLNGGVCVSGNCDCPNGYDGIACENESREKYIGTYEYVRQCDGGTIFTWTEEITEVSGFPAFFEFDDLGHGFSGNVRGTCTGATSFDIEEQTLNRPTGTFPGNYTLEGAGTFDLSTQAVTATYSFKRDETGETLSCEINLTRQ